MHSVTKKLVALAAVLLVSASLIPAMAQKVTLNYNNTRIDTVLGSIQRQTGLRMVYSDQTIDVSRKVTVNVTNSELTDVLDELLAGTGTVYEISDGKLYFKVSKPASDGVVTVSGKVTDEGGSPVAGAYVQESGSKNNGVITDADGRFEIKVSPQASLDVSFMGFLSQKVALAGRESVSIVLKEDRETLDEVIVIGYGTMRKKDLTGATSVISGGDVETRKTTNLSLALQGATPGLLVTRSGGDPEATGSLRIRGITSISNANPLVIVDGVPSTLDLVNPNDVESITVLKDAASSSIYGARAAAGVIVITTKRAKESSLDLNYSYEYNLEFPTELPEYVGAIDYMKMANELRYNDNPSAGLWQTYPEDLVTNYVSLNESDPDRYPIVDWQNAAFKKSTSRQTHSLLISAGNKTVRTKASLRYDTSDALYVNKNFNRVMVRVNNDINVNKYLSAHLDLNMKHSKSVAPIDAPWSSRMTPPIYAVKWSDGRYADVKDGGNIFPRLYDGGTNTAWYNHLNGKASLDFLPFDGLKISAVAAYNLNFNKFKKFSKALTYTDYDYPDTPKAMSGHVYTNLTETRNDGYDSTYQLVANYDKTFGRHSVSAMAGYECFYTFTEGLSAMRDRFAMTSFPYLDRGNSSYQDMSGNADHNAYRSYFGRLMYNYDGRYLVQANFRRDGSSRFAKQYRWGNFPSVSVGYVLSEEPFVKRLNLEWLSMAKLKASYGTLGNEQIGSAFPYQAAVNVSEALLYGQKGPETFASAAQWNYAVEDITWETTKTWNVGIETSFLSDRLWLNADLYRKMTEDMLMDLTIPRYIGYSDPKVNAGTMRTNGFEVEVGYRDSHGDFNWSVSANLSDFISKITYLKGQDLGSEVSLVNIEGGQFNEWYGYLSDGLYLSEEDLASSPKTSDNVKVGDIKYKDISGPDGVPDGKISPEYDRVLLGGSLPRYTFGARIGLGWKNLDFSMTLQGVGKQNVRMTRTMIEPMQSNWLNNPAILKGNYWSTLNTDEENASAKYPRLSSKSASNNYAMSDYWLFNGRYLRLKNITVGYSLPENLMNRITCGIVKKVRIYASANDLFCLNGYPKGWDPEVGGINYPITTSIIGGVSVTF